ncbi:F-box DNA helicase 1 isoform X2 [Neopsephotus bourkii]|uniref:F-box DNA helicase 1 isoform X2 n=1 Tax=Neopsephotus bourkii TaxID=309878 RepID=UPI002AA55A34|nr:F-box DNA helicase 1 isoform X2 [Neopsephotus bourkii]
MSAEKRFKKTHLTAQECEALAECSLSLTQPLSQSQSRGDVNRGLHPSHRTRRHQGGQGQLNVADCFQVPRTQQVGPDGTKDRRVKEQLLDPNFTDDSFRNDSAFLEDEDFVPAPKESSRKRPLSTAGTLKPEHDLWAEPEKKPLVVHPEHSGIKQELDDMEIEPVPDTHYGLLGTRTWEVPQGSIDMLPVEVLRNIFAFLPVTDLYQSLSLVCHCWRDIVSDPLFIPWKKLYHRYLNKEATALRSVEQVMKDFAITKEQEGCVLGLIRCVSAIPTNWKVDPGAVLRCLKSHHLFTKAEVCVVNKLPHLQSRAGPESAWAIIAVMVLFSDGVSDIQKLIRCLQRPCSTLYLVDVTETLYCMATLLSAMRNKGIAISNRIHYSIFYCLYLMENASVTMHTVEEDAVASCCRQDLRSGRPEVKLTHEQQRILNHKIEPGQVVKIVAFAGSGKTSILVKYAEKFAGLRFLYVAFNKAVAEKGKSVFPRNVTCRTFHSLAYGSVGKLYKEKGKLNFSKMSAYSISSLLRNPRGQSLFLRGKMVSQTLESFFASSDEEICEEHSPHWFRNAHDQTQPVSRAEKEINVKEAKEIWHNMKKLDGDAEKKYKMTCDGYLKLWQLSKPQLSGYDAIFVDEAQDCTPAIVDIVLSQRCGVILVGDPHQQIYTFRGAVNTLYSVRHTHVYYLTQSFRFGPEIAYVGATILNVCKRIRNKTLVGGNQKGDVKGSIGGKMTLLSRSNLNVFDNVVALTGEDRPVKVHMIGGLHRFGLRKIYDLWKLSQPVSERRRLNLVINDSFIKKWEGTRGFFGLKEYAKHVNDKELETKIVIVEKYRERIPKLVEQIERNHVPHEAGADYIIGTVHQAKGLEFDTVLLADDFVQVPALSGRYQIRTDPIIGKGTAWCGPYPDVEVRSKPVLSSAIRCHSQGIIDLVVSFTARCMLWKGWSLPSEQRGGCRGNLEVEKLLQCHVCAWEMGEHTPMSSFSCRVLPLPGGRNTEQGRSCQWC